MTHLRLFTISAVCFFSSFSSLSQSVIADSLINPALFEELIGVLSSDSLKGRRTGTEDAKRAADFISSAFNKARLSPVDGHDGYLVPFEYADGKNCNNVMAILPGKTRPEELVIFSAHYDHVGTKSIADPRHARPSQHDTIYNGANDNASGVSGLIALARYFSARGDNERSLMFVAFSGEELGMLGSKAMASAIDSSAVIAQVNMEMLGRVKTTKDKAPFITGAEFSDLRQLLNNRLHQADSAQYKRAYFTNDRPYRSLRLFERSDNYPLAMRGMIAHTIAATAPTDKYYHSAKDEAATIDFESMAAIVKAIALATSGLADGSDTPERKQ